MDGKIELVSDITCHRESNFKKPSRQMRAIVLNPIVTHWYYFQVAIQIGDAVVQTWTFTANFPKRLALNYPNAIFEQITRFHGRQ